MKKFLKISGIVILVIILLMIILPFLFKDKIIELIKTEANKNLTATLNFEDAGLNFFSSFPDLTLSLDELTIVNKAPFEGDTLLRLKEFSASVDLWSVIGGDKIRVEGISLIEPSVFVYVLEDSTANYNITKPDTAAAADTAAGGDMSIELKEYSVENGTIAYVDQTSDMVLIIRNLNHSGEGDFSQENFLLETETSIGELTVEKGGIKYLNGAEAKAVINLDADMPSKKFTFKENEVQVNNLRLKFDGFVRQTEESLVMDLNFASVNNNFKEIISLIPAVYSKNFAGIEASGTMSVKGNAKGEYRDESLPAFSVSFNIDNGKFKYPELPAPVNNINMDLGINNPGGSPDNTVINMKSLHFELGNEPFDASLLVKTPQSAPYVDLKAKGRIDLAKLKNAVYLEDVTRMEGVINSDFSAKGTIGSDAKSVENISAEGNISFRNIVYGSTQMSDEIKIAGGSLVLTPKRFNLNDLNVQIGKSDLHAAGQLENMISYVLSDGTIKGSLTLNSGYFDLNPFMKRDEETAPAADRDTAKIEAASIPERVNFTLNSDFKKIIYDNLTLTDVKGVIVIADEKATLKNLSMNTLGGTIVADGFYHAPAGETPDITFNLAVSNLAFRETYKSFVTVQRFAPMAQYIDGNFSSKLTMTTDLDGNMQPMWDSFNSKGSLSIPNAAIKGFKPLEVVGDKLSIEALKNPSLNNVSTNFTITDGRLYIEPFTFKVLNYDLVLSGSNGIDQSIDYDMGIKIPASNLKQKGNKAISSILKKDVELITANSIEVKANITGSIQDPSVSTSAGNIVEDTKEQVTEQVKEEVTKQIEEKKEEVQKEVQKQADTLENKLKKEASKKIKDLFKRK